MPCPYNFPATTRAAQLVYVASNESRFYNSRSYPYVWDVKAHVFDFDAAALAVTETPLNPARDSAFADYIETLEDFHGMMCEDAALDLENDEWTSYPGTDQGDWSFSFGGRSGGWLILKEWRGLDASRFYQDAGEAEGAALHGYHCEPTNLCSWDDDQIEAFYRGIVCANADFTQTKAALNVLHAAAYFRSQWEAEQEELEEAAATTQAAAMADDRPDLYAGAGS